MDAPLLVALCLLASIATGKEINTSYLTIHTVSSLKEIIHVHVFVSGQVSNDPEPEFLAPLDNITVTQGRDVSFTCVVDHLGPYKVR